MTDINPYCPVISVVTPPVSCMIIETLIDHKYPEAADETIEITSALTFKKFHVI